MKTVTFYNVIKGEVNVVDLMVTVYNVIKIHLDNTGSTFQGCWICHQVLHCSSTSKPHGLMKNLQNRTHTWSKEELITYIPRKIWESLVWWISQHRANIANEENQDTSLISISVDFERSTLWYAAAIMQKKRCTTCICFFVYERV